MKTRLLLVGTMTLALPAQSALGQVAGPMTPVAPPTPAVSTPQPGRVAAGASGAASGGGYSGGDFVMSDNNPALWGGVRRKRVPSNHTVREGDTLWKICDQYYGDPWAWPQLWAHNKSITNPHWIYPGDRIRLLGAPTGPLSADAGSEKIRLSRSNVYGGGPVTFKQNAFVDPKELADAGEVHAAKSEKLLLSDRDEIYIERGKFDPKVGKSYAVYRVKEKLENSDGDEVGSVVEVRGTIQVKRAPKDKVATALITESVKPIERGDKIGPLRRRYKRLPVVRATQSQSAQIVGGLEGKVLFALNDVVFVDRGKNQGVRQGNRFLVVRTGDARKRLLQDMDDDDEKWPREAVAEISIMDPRKNVSVGLITRSLKETKVGDHVIMRKGY